MSTLEAESTLTDRYQTTVPETVRRALRLGKRDRIHYDIRPGGEVVMTRASVGDDPVLGRFLDYAWVNDEGTRRAYESSDDAYRVFRRMLETGNPPDSWDARLEGSEGHRARCPAPGAARLPA